MLKDRIFTFTLLVVALAAAICTAHLKIRYSIFLPALFIYWLFSFLYSNLGIASKNGSTNIHYGISYSLSFGLFTGPLGLLIFETIYRFTIYINRKRTNTADPSELIDTFFNIGSFVLSNSIAFYLFMLLNPYFASVPFGFWILIFALVIVTSFFTDIFLIISFFFMGDMNSLKDALDFLKSRSILDSGKISFTNGLLFLFLKTGKWDMLLSLFILNYIVSRSFISKAQSIQNKNERDKFEHMAYTDFLTGVSNRAYMDKMMAELNQSDDYIGIVVADIDNFKKINDSYNHAVGDRIIKHFATSIKDLLGPDDCLFRSGGEEFTIFLRQKSYESTLNHVKAVQKRVENSTVDVEFNNDIHSISYTASFGLYYYKVNAFLSMEKGYIAADHLLLQSKQLGKNKVSAQNGSHQNVCVSI